MANPLLNHRYLVLQSLGEGGFGKTFLAEDTQMPSRRRCVIKQLKPLLSFGSDRPEVFQIVQQRFAREAAVLEAVGKGHSRIPDLYAYFSEAGQFYLVQEWIEGKPLTEMSQQDWSEKRVRQLMVDVLDALEHVHAQNIIHRDIKPDNIMMRRTDGLPCLIDFGAVKELMSTTVESGGIEKSSLVIGSPGFMSPEQAAGRPTFSSDLYSLAMTAIFLLTRRSPTEIPTASHNGEVLWQQFAPGVTASFADILSRAVHPFPQNRYATASDMLEALQPLPKTEASLPQHSPQNVKPQPLERSASQARTVAASPAARPLSNQPSTVASVPPNALAQAAASPFPWKLVGILWGGVIGLGIGAAVLAGLTPQISFRSSDSKANVENIQATIASQKEQIQAEPNSPDIRQSLAENYLEVGEYEEAIAQIQAVLDQDPQNAAALLTRGKAEFTQGNYDQALETFAQSIELDGSSAEAFDERGNTYYEKGLYDEAIADYRKAISVDPTYGQAYVDWSAINVLRGNTQEAIANLDLAVENSPNLISAYVNRGSRYAEMGDRTKAAQDWKKAASLSPQTAQDYASRAYAKSRLNQKDAAINDYNQALVINPNFPRGYIGRAYILYERGEKEQALDNLEKALAINPNSVVALILKGEILAYQTNPDWPGAIEAYSTALAVNPNDPDVLNNRCSAYVATQQLDLALADCDRGLQIQPNDASIYLTRGNIRLNKNNFEDAVQDYSRAIKINEQAGNAQLNQAAYSNRASALVNIGDFNGALNDINKAIEIKPDAPEDYFKRGMVKVAMDNREEGAQDMRKASELYVQQGRTESHKNVLAMMEQLDL